MKWSVVVTRFPEKAYSPKTKQSLRHISLLMSFFASDFRIYRSIHIYQRADSNSARKRTSFSLNIRKSLTLYFRLVMRSMPIPECISGIHFGIDATGLKHVGIDHAASENLHPTGAFAERATLATTKIAAYIHFRRWLCKREI